MEYTNVILCGNNRVTGCGPLFLHRMGGDADEQ